MANNGFGTKQGFNVNPCGYQQIVGLVAATGLTAPTTRGKVHGAIIRPETQNVRWRDDGVAPTASVGNLLQTTDPPLEYTGDLSAIQFIQVLATATLNVSYYNADA